jgi:uncharacterized lipoprotein YddW (UPF0748 family)
MRSLGHSFLFSAALAALLFFIPKPAFSGQAVSQGLFVSILQEPQVLSDRREIERLVERAKQDHYEVLFVQVYRANEAWFKSRNARTTSYRKSLETVGEDPLALLIRRAHASGIQVHAWMNLLSLGADGKAPILEKYGPSILTRNTREKKTLEDYRVDGQYFLEPGDPRVSGTLSRILGELVTAYPELDGVQFDYIRYPDVQPAYGHTRVNLERYRKTTGATSTDELDPRWRKWKRDQVTALVRKLRAKALSLHPGLQVSTTGLMPYVRAREEAFQDWKEWVNTGLADFVTLMCYSRDNEQFEKYLSDAKRQLPGLQKVNVAVGAYKLADLPAVFAHQWDRCRMIGSHTCVELD